MSSATRAQTHAGINTAIAASYLDKALVMSHPRRGVLASDAAACLPLRLATLSNLSCCMCRTGKPSLGVRYASEAAGLLAQNRAAFDDPEVCSSEFAAPLFPTGAAASSSHLAMKDVLTPLYAPARWCTPAPSTQSGGCLINSLAALAAA